MAEPWMDGQNFHNDFLSQLPQSIFAWVSLAGMSISGCHILRVMEGITIAEKKKEKYFNHLPFSVILCKCELRMIMKNKLQTKAGSENIKQGHSQN